MSSRLLLESSIHDRFIARLVERAKQIRVGPGDDPATEMGPLVSQTHMEKVLSYIKIGQEEGARLICGGDRITKNGLDKGYFVEPTIFVDTTPEMRIVQEEIFGPVLAVQKFTDEVMLSALPTTPSTDWLAVSLRRMEPKRCVSSKSCVPVSPDNS